MPRKIEISHKTIIFTLIVLGSLWLIYFLRSVILQMFVALLIMIIINPLVRRLEKFKFPRAAAVSLIYVLIIAVLTLVVSLVLPPLIEQTTNFVSSLPVYISGIQTPFFSGAEIAGQFAQNVSQLPSQAVRAGVSVFSNIIAIVAVFVFSFYLLMERENLDKLLTGFVGDDNSRRITKVIDRLELKLGGWVRAELILMTIVAVLNYVGLLILGVHFAIPLAILAGLLEAVPTFGPIVGAIPAVIVGFSINPVTGISVAVLAFMIQQLENYVFVPKVMQKSVGVSPIVTLFALVIGFKLAGVAGAILAVPTVITLEVVAKEYFFK